MKIFNITNHNLTADQAEGMDVIEMPEQVKKVFGQVGHTDYDVAVALATVLEWVNQQNIEEEDIVAVQGHSGLCFALVTILLRRGKSPVYAATERRSVESILPSGEVVKKSIFRHVCWNNYMV